jgi:hypothetical protein
MKKFIICILIAVMLSITPAYACTSFAIYSDQPIYGMNFDYYNTEIRFCVAEEKGQDIFALVIREGDLFIPTALMNESGSFITLQMQYPATEAKSSRAKDELYIDELMMYAAEPRIEALLGEIENTRLVHRANYTLHAMLADIDGNAVIAEAGTDANELLPINDNFIVMTNFKHSDFRDMPLEEISGTGADRYRAACKYLAESRENFNIDNAFACLQKTAQAITLCSMVFEPRESCIYLALDKNFEKLWKISLKDKSIETYKGFEESIKFQIPEGMEGILASDLAKGNFSNYFSNKQEPSQEKGTGIYLLLLPALGAALIGAIILFKKHK